MYADLSEGLDDIRQSIELRLDQLRSFAPRTPSMAAPYLNRILVVGMVSGLQMIFSVGRFLVLRFPLAWPVALGLFVIFKKIYAPQRASRLSWEDWAQVIYVYIFISKPSFFWVSGTKSTYYTHSPFFTASS